MILPVIVRILVLLLRLETSTAFRSISLFADTVAANDSKTANGLGREAVWSEHALATNCRGNGVDYIPARLKDDIPREACKARLWLRNFWIKKYFPRRFAQLRLNNMHVQRVNPSEYQEDKYSPRSPYHTIWVYDENSFHRPNTKFVYKATVLLNARGVEDQLWRISFWDPQYPAPAPVSGPLSSALVPRHPQIVVDVVADELDDEVEGLKQFVPWKTGRKYEFDVVKNLDAARFVDPLLKERISEDGEPEEQPKDPPKTKPHRNTENWAIALEALVGILKAMPS